MPSCVPGFKPPWENFTHEETVQQRVLHGPMSHSQEGDVSKVFRHFPQLSTCVECTIPGSPTFCGALKAKRLGVGLE